MDGHSNTTHTIARLAQKQIFTSTKEGHKLEKLSGFPAEWFTPVNLFPLFVKSEILRQSQEW